MDRYEEDIKRYYDRWQSDFEERAFAYSRPAEKAQHFDAQRIANGLSKWQYDWEARIVDQHPFDTDAIGRPLVITVCIGGYSKTEVEFRAAREWFDFQVKIWREHKAKTE